MAWRVTAEAPTRVDIAGGTLDLWPVHFLLPKAATVNVAVTLPASVDIALSKDQNFHFHSEDQNAQFSGSFVEACESTALPLVGRILQSVWHKGLPPLEIKTRAKSPAGAGLGGSSCLAVTIEKALCLARSHLEVFEIPSEQKLVRTAQDAEALIIKAPTGCQDYWGAVRGGLNVIRFPFGGETVETRSPGSLPGLKESLILCYSGKSRASAANNWMIFKKSFDGDERVLGLLRKIGELASACAERAWAGDFKAVLQYSEEEWKFRRQIWPDIVSEETERLDQAACREGATFTRVCGAGGGGVMAVFAVPEVRERVIHALEGAGGKVLEATTSEVGLTARLLVS